MYIGSQAFRTANARAIQKHRIRGTIDEIPFTGSNILGGSLTISNQCSEATDFKLGSARVGQMTATFLRNLSVTPTSWSGRKITVYFSLCIDEVNDTWEEFQIGEWYVSEATINADGVSVVCYDSMSKLDKQLPTDYLASGTIASITRAICNTCGLTFGMTDQEVESLPNGNHPFGLYTPNEATKYRDLIYYLSNAVGGFATIDRNGNLVYRTYDDRSATQVSIGATKRVTGANFSDFEVGFEAAIFENADGTTQKVGSSSGATYYNGFNPFMEYGTTAEKTAIRTNVTNVIREIAYTPFTVELMSAPVFELGDVIEFTGGIIEDLDKVGIVQSVTWSLSGGIKIQGFGSNPAIQDVKTTQEMANSASRKSNTNSEVIYHDFTNISPITVSSEPIKVTDIQFTSNKEGASVEMWEEVQVNTSKTGASPMTLQALYYLDGELLDRKPIETYGEDGYHILDLHYFENIVDVGSHRWEVYLVASGGTAQVRANDAIAVLKGQGLSKAEGWTGVIILDDDTPLVPMPFDILEADDILGLVDITDNRTEELEDDIGQPPIRMSTASNEDSVEVFLYIPQLLIVSEDKAYNLTDESGDYNVSSQY